MAKMKDEKARQEQEFKEQQERFKERINQLNNTRLYQLMEQDWKEFESHVDQKRKEKIKKKHEEIRKPIDLEKIAEHAKKIDELREMNQQKRLTSKEDL